MKTKSLEIFITKENKSLLEEMNNKYRVSISTICSEIYKELICIYPELQKCKIKERKNLERIHIKPKRDEHLPFQMNGKSVNNTINKYFEQIKLIENQQDKEFKKANKRIIKQLYTIHESNWNYNNNFRQICRMARKNKTYLKAIMGEI